MKTRKKIKRYHNKTKKHKKITCCKLKVLNKNYKLYASKIFEGAKILQYNRNQEKIHNDTCLMENISWFGDLEVAKSYKTKDTRIYRWKTKKLVNLLDITMKNNRFLENLFEKTKAKLIPTIKITNKLVDYKHPYLNMRNNEKALFEFKFCFGFLTLQEQYLFMKFIKYLIENKIYDMKRRNGESILTKLNIKIKYYELGKYFTSTHTMNRLSFYDLDKHALMNLCKCLYDMNLDIAGVYQKNTHSFWFPDFILYKMNIEEYILFNPHHNLVYDKVIE
jgi:hypothetical protein